MPIAIQNIETGLIKEWGFVEPGSFVIPEGYQEIEINNPPTQDQIEIIQPIAQRMDTIFQSMPALLRAKYGPLRVSIKGFMEMDPIDYEAIQITIESQEATSELESTVKQTLLNILERDSEI